MLNENTKKCIEAALDEAYLKGFRDAKDGKPSDVAMTLAAAKAVTEVKAAVVKDEWSGKWITDGGMFVEIERVSPDVWHGTLYSTTGDMMNTRIPYDKNGVSSYGKPFWLKEKLSGSNKEALWPRS